MNTQIITFVFEAQQIRFVGTSDRPEWIAADVCAVLEIKNVADALSRLDEDEKGVATTDTPGGKQELLTINESGLYSLVFTSRKPQAKAFKKWITSEVLPSIRKTGSYSVQSNAQPTPINSSNKLMEQAPAFQKMLTGLKCPEGLATQITFKMIGKASPHLLPGLEIAAKEMGILQAAKEDFLTPTQLADRLTELTGEKFSCQSVNSRLALKGFQAKDKKGWKLTQAGEEFGVRKPFSSSNSNFSGWQILWKESIVNELMDIAA
jgi:prophage antirepressor-like protein